MARIIDYLNESDYDNPGYKAVVKQLEAHTIIKCTNAESLKTEILNLGRFNENVILTILSHGHERGLAKKGLDTLLTWCELLELVDRCKANHRLILNLLSVCKSNNILNSSNFCKHRIDEIWVTTDEVISINKSLLALKENNFDNFHSQLDGSEKLLYRKLTYRND